MKQVLLFDFDGTLFDTGPGVINCVVYALEHLGIYEPDKQKLRKFMGPPLYDMFRELYGLNDALGNEAVRLYRERYQPTGIWECAPYPGIVELLKKLRGAGYLLAVAKTEVVKAVLEHFEIQKCPDQALMIGDRKYDVLGASAVCVPCLGVRYGYGEPGELEEAGAIVVVDSIKELEAYLIK